MDRNQLRLAVLKPLTLLSVLIASALFVTVLSVRPDVGRATPAGDARRPASRHSAAGAVHMNVMNLPCWDRARDVEHAVAARWVRLTGRACVGAGAGDVGSITVRNLTNGFVATVFATGPGLTTDYIPLNDGGNDVVIAFDRGAGARFENRLHLTR